MPFSAASNHGEQQADAGELGTWCELLVLLLKERTDPEQGLAIHRSILIGNTSTPLTDVERITAPPDHTHRWTIAVRSAASHPLPTVHEPEQSTSSAPLTTPLAREDASRSGTPAAAPSATTTPAAAASASSAGVSTRGREHETDYHKMVGGKDDISHFIKRVQFKLHETYSQSTRSA